MFFPPSHNGAEDDSVVRIEKEHMDSVEMNVKELMDELKKLPPDLEVILYSDGNYDSVEEQDIDDMTVRKAIRSVILQDKKQHYYDFVAIVPDDGNIMLY